MATVAFLTLSGCGWMAEDVSGSRYSDWQNYQNPVLPPPQTRVMQTAEGTWLEPDRTPRPVPTQTEIAELHAAKKRISQLEDEVSSLRNDMAMLMPALTKLTGIADEAAAMAAVKSGAPGVAGNLNGLHPAAGAHLAGAEAGYGHEINQPSRVAEESLDPEMMEDQSMAMAPLAPAVPQVQSNTAASQNAGYTPPAFNVPAIKNVRFGEQNNGKSRLVIDITDSRTFSYEIDNNEKILVLEIPGTVWNAGPVTRNVQDSPLVESMATTPDGQGGTRIVFQLKDQAKILWSQAIPPAGSQGHRIVFDLASI